MRNKFRYMILVADLKWLLGAFVLANLLYYGVNGLIPSMKLQRGIYLPVIAISVILWTIFFLKHRLEGASRGWHFPALVSSIMVASTYLTIALLLVIMLSPRTNVPPLVLVYFGMLVLVGALVIRGIAWLLVKSRLWSGSVRRVVIIGQGRLVSELARKISAHPEYMIEVVGFLSLGGKRLSTEEDFLASRVGKLRTLDVLNLLREKKVREIIIADNLPQNAEMDKFLAACQFSGMRVQFIPHSFELYVSTAKLTEIDDIPLISLGSRNLSFLMLEMKRVVDIVCGTILFTLSLPLTAAIFLALRQMKGKALKKEARSGLHGKEFFLYRFNIDRWSPDLIGFEKFLAERSLTELPQLWNVIRGDMSLVGPRPESPDRVKHYTIWQRERLSVKPGLTGLAQVNGLRENHSSEEKAHFDLQYIYRYSGLLDLSLIDFSIILETVWTICCRPREEELPEVQQSPHLNVGRLNVGRMIANQEVVRVDSSQSR
jgi:lipopolysaccharide/colanic/teichoic acid biosynthesis glycosyltransferase